MYFKKSVRLIVGGKMRANILDFGAKSQEDFLNTDAIQKAIDYVNENGGGQVVIPAGDYLSGALCLKSNIDFHLEAGACLISSLTEEDFPKFMDDFEDDNEDTGWEDGCFLMARHETNISITGLGKIDGRGREVFYEDDDDGGSHESPLKVKGFRPRMSFFEDVSGLTVKNVCFYDSAFWTLHMAGCKDVLIDGVKILNNDRGPNNDGIDPDSCQRVQIRNCNISCADDCIVVKTTEPMSKLYGPSCDILISDCILYSHSSALKIGTETWGPIYNVSMHDCIIKDSTRAVGIWSRDGGEIHDIYIHHIFGNTLRYADRKKQDSKVVVWWGKGEPVFISSSKRANVDRLPGKIYKIYFDHLNLKCEGPFLILGEKYSPINGISVSDSHFLFTKQGSLLPDCIDEQPSVRGIHKEKLACVMLRDARDCQFLRTSFDVNQSLEPYIESSCRDMSKD